MKIESFDHIHLYSNNSEVSAKFYIEHFESTEVFRKKGAGGEKVYLSLGGLILVIGPLPDDRAISISKEINIRHQIGLDHFGLRVKNLTKAVQELKEAGVKILSEPIKGSSGISYAFIAAPDGVIIELTEYGLIPKLYLKAKKII